VGVAGGEDAVLRSGTDTWGQRAGVRRSAPEHAAQRREREMEEGQRRLVVPTAGGWGVFVGSKWWAFYFRNCPCNCLYLKKNCADKYFTT